MPTALNIREERSRKTNSSFENSIGSVLDNTVIIHSPKKREFSMNEIAFIEILKVNRRTINIVAASIGLLLLIVGFIANQYRELFFLIGFSLLLVSLLKRFEAQYMQIVFCVPNRIVVPISKNQIGEVKALIRAFQNSQRSLHQSI
jgi:hypothetical protein